MWAYIEDNTIVQTNTDQTRLVVRGSRFPHKYAREYTKEQKEDYGVYEVVNDTTNYKDPNYYYNGAESMVFSGGVVTLSWAAATALSLADINWTQAEIDDGRAPAGADTDTLNYRGLKYDHKQTIKSQAKGLIEPYDWYYVRKTDTGTAVSSSITDFRAAVRTKSGTMETAIDNAANVDALSALYAYVNTGTEESPVMERPLGEWPDISDY